MKPLCLRASRGSRPALASRGLRRALAVAACFAGAACSDGGAGLPGDPCERMAPISIRVGQVLEPAELVGDGVCLGSSSSEDIVIVVTTGSGATSSVSVDVLGTGFEPGLTELPVESAAGAGRSGPGRIASMPGSPFPGPVEPAVGQADHRWLRETERAELMPRMRAGGSAPGARVFRAGKALLAGGGPRSAPQPGSEVTYPTAVSCDAAPSPRTGRVVAVGEHVVVVVDLDVPGGGFEDSELMAFADLFDQSIHPTVTGAFGDASDIDGNQRVVVFFTPASNQLRAGGTGVVGGFFWGGDLFPAQAGGSTTLAPCAASGEAEILYLSVPDPDGEVGNPIRKDQLESGAVAAHELQHLLNASRRIYVNDAEVLEETWLNEGLSYIAEELVFFATSGGTPRADLSDESLSEPEVLAAFNAFQFGNVGRYNIFLQAPHVHSMMGSDRLETRGATWSFLRYALDREPDAAAALARLANSVTAGVGSLEGAFIGEPLDLMASWAVSLAADNLPGQSDPRFQQLSWNLKSIIPRFRIDGRYPLAVIGVPPDQGVRFSLRTGGAGYGSVRVREGEAAALRVVPGPDAQGTRAFLVRVH